MYKQIEKKNTLRMLKCDTIDDVNVGRLGGQDKYISIGREIG
jgi:hypothetical protein